LTVKSFKSRFLQLTEYQYFGSETWVEYSSDSLGIDLNSAESVRARTTSMLYNYQKNVQNTLNSNGQFDVYSQGGKLAWPFVNAANEIGPQMQIAYTCMQLYSNPSEQYPDYCRNATGTIPTN